MSANLLSYAGWTFLPNVRAPLVCASFSRHPETLFSPKKPSVNVLARRYSLSVVGSNGSTMASRSALEAQSPSQEHPDISSTGDAYT